MQISDYRYVEKVFENLRQKLRLSSYTFDAKTNVLIWGFFVDNDEVISSSRASIPRELGCIQEYQLRGAQDVVRYHAKIDRGAIIERICDDLYFLSLDEIYSVSRSSNQVGESKGTCLLRVSLVSG